MKTLAKGKLAGLELLVIVGILLFQTNFQPLVLSVAADTNVHYVDSSNGSDADPGTSRDQAWQTIQDAANNAAAGITYYVSRTGSNGDGRSWATAWNELNKINWSVVQPGDTILLDGGKVPCNFPVMVASTNEPTPAGCGMVYQTPLTFQKSGVEGSLITVKLSDESGRNGTARLFGGRYTPLPYCGQTGYTPNAHTAQAAGVNVNDQDYVVLDGGHWAGIMVYGHDEYGVRFYYNSDHITLRNLEVFDNGTYSPDNPGIRAHGNNLVFERLLVHDNGQDGFQNGYSTPLTDVTWRRVWLFNQRPHPTAANESWNYCRHTDGIQLYALRHSNLLIEDSIVGPGLTNNLIFGNVATLSNVTIRNSLVVSKHGTNNAVHSESGATETNFILDHVTVVRDHGDGQPSAVNVRLYGSGHVVSNSMLVGGDVNAQGTTGRNVSCYNLLSDTYSTCTQSNVNPQFIDADYRGIGVGFADFDFTITNPALPRGIGSSITSVAQLLNGVTPPPAVTPTPTVKPSPTVTPSPASSKVADPRVARKNGVITYTITIAGNGNPTTVIDPLPLQVDYLTSALTCPGTVTYDAATRQVKYSGTPPAGRVCTIQIRVQVNTNKRIAITNSATIDNGQSPLKVVSAAATLNGPTLYLPLIRK